MHPPAPRTARLIGTRYRPAVELRFVNADPLPAGVPLGRSPRKDLPAAADPPTMLDWVRRLPQRQWDAARGAWVSTCLGPDPDKVLADAGFDVDVSRGAPAGVTSLADLYSLKVQLDPGDEHVTHVYTRLYPMESVKAFLPASATWSWSDMRFSVATTGMPSSTLAVPRAVAEAAKRLMDVRVSSGPLALAAQAAARSKSLDEAGASVEAELLAHAGEIPDWFGLDLYPYQRAGALSVLAGHSGLVDEPGLGKTRQALAALALADAQRIVIVVPPVVLTNWRREVMQAGIAGPVPKPIPKSKRSKAGNGAGEGLLALAPPNGHLLTLPDGQIIPQSERMTTHHVVIVQAGRKVPEFPDRGVIIISDSLIASRPSLSDAILDWRADAFVLDEAHRTMNWSSDRSESIRRLASLINGMRITISGTPMFASPSELATQLAITGHLNSVFGGLDSFLNTYCRKNKYDKWVARKATLPDLHTRLMAHVWVRRTKAQVLPDLPKKSRHAKYLDVDLRDFRKAHLEVRGHVEEWVAQFIKDKGRKPDAQDAETWIRSQLHLVTLLRRAAGMAKVDAASDLIREHVAATTEHGPGGQPIYTRPLIVWTHHKDVSTAMAAAVPAAVGETRVIVGSTSAEERGRIVDDFQAGKVPVLVASITAAGVGITLTRGCDALFVETDWSPQLVVQAEDRQCRIGQERPVTVTTLIAEGTLDPQVQATQRRKISVLEGVLVGGDLSVAVLDGGDDPDDDGSSESMKVLMAMFTEILAKPPAAVRTAA